MTTDSRTEELAEVIAELAEGLDVPGVAVGITADGTEAYAVHGSTHIESPLPVDEHTLFQIGSTGKTYTATMVMRLVDQGRLSLDDRVRKHLPDFRVRDPDVSEAVTVLNLLNHTAGWDGEFFLDTGPGDDALAKFVAAMADLPQTTPFNGIASYSNTSLCVAGHIVSVITGMTYEDAMQDLVLQPLGLDETFNDLNGVITRRFAVGHVKQDGVNTVSRQYQMPRSAAPGGSPISTVMDQIRYARFHLGDGRAADGTRVLAEEHVRRMQQPTAELGSGGQVGISWMLRDIAGTRVVSHGGTTIGQQSSFEMVPQHNFAITVLTNAHHGSLLAEAVRKWAFEEYLDIVEEPPAILDLDAAALAEFAGTYLRDELQASLVVEGDRLLVTITLTEHGRETFLKELGSLPPVPEPFHIALIGPDEYLAVDGELEGDRGKFLRDHNGAIASIDLGGRLANKMVT